MTTNILIVGNGFDLSHYLPTKYDHFMDVMEAIEEKDLAKPLSDVFYSPFDHPIHLITKWFEIKRLFNNKTYEMNFDELFKKCRENGFISKTKEIYKTDQIVLSCTKVLEIQELLKENHWYQYFKDHVKEVKTWIDFETKIDEVLKAMSCFFNKSEEKINEKGYFVKRIIYRGKPKSNEIFLWLEYCKVLEIFGILKADDNASHSIDDQEVEAFSYQIKDEYSKKISNYQGLDKMSILSNLHAQLEEFIEIFNLYLKLIIDKLKTNYTLKIIDENWVQPDEMFSFNYTNTFQKLYGDIQTDFLHGRFGEKQNIVLGISDLEDDCLKKLKAYGFTKYHQKLFKKTDYLFLYRFRKKIQQLEDQINILKFKQDREIPKLRATLSYGQQIEKLQNDSILNLVVSIWGHSLDVSDKEYIIDLFSLNDSMDRNVRVIVYYFDNLAKFSLLNNLLAILEKDKVEHWMKNGWLKFEKNPEISFDIENVELDKEAS